MTWKKLGIAITPDFLEPYGLTHPIVSFAMPLEKDKVKVYFMARDLENRSEFRSLVLNLDTMDTDALSDTLFKHGKKGKFDEHGVEVCSLVHIDKSVSYVYYAGWKRLLNAPARNEIGLALFDRNDGITRLQEKPIFGITDDESHSCTVPFVMKDDSIFKMWYCSIGRIDKSLGMEVECYDIKYVESEDGIHWSKKPQTAVTFKDSNEFAISRPCVIKEDGIYKMWYSFKGESYRIGYAQSIDGKNWQRFDELVGIDISNRSNGFDDEMIEYPFVFKQNKQKYLFYSANGYGKSGVGLARLEK